MKKYLVSFHYTTGKATVVGDLIISVQSLTENELDTARETIRRSQRLDYDVPIIILSICKLDR